MPSKTNRQTKKLLKQFDQLVSSVQDLLLERLGAGEAVRLVGEIRCEYEKIIPVLPEIGRKQLFQQFNIGTGWALAMYRVLVGEGWPVEKIGQLVFDVTAAYLDTFPKFVQAFLRWFSFSAPYRLGVRYFDWLSHKRKYPMDYVFDYISGEGTSFDYGVDYHECLSCKFLARENALEIAPYLCPADILYSERWGWGLSRTKTLADGDEMCNFRFKKGGETRVKVGVPLDIQRAIRKT